MSSAIQRRKDRRTRLWHTTQDCRFGPDAASLATWADVELNFLDGLTPDVPPIRRGHRVLSIGSCFARSVANHLRTTRPDLTVNAGPDGVGLLFFFAGFVSTHTILQQFAWALGAREIPTDSTLYAEQSSGRGSRTIVPIPADDAARSATRRAIEDAEVFIITLGLSEVWEDATTGDVFFKAVPRAEFDPARHRFRLTTPAENLENLRELRRLIRSVRPDAPIIVSLSPVPLVATFRPQAAAVSNAVSKAVLRVAIDTFVADARAAGDANVHYWPSYEIVTEHFGAAAWEPDRRHVRPDVVTKIMRLFERHYVEAPAPARRIRGRRASRGRA